MTKKTIVTSVLVLLGLAGLMWWGRSNEAAELSETQGSERSSFIVSEALYDFGAISMANGLVDKVFAVTNATDRDVTLSSIVTSCMCTTAYMQYTDRVMGPFGMPGHGGLVKKVNEVIKAGESFQVRVVYDPNAHGPAGVGPIDRFIELTEANGGVTQLEIKALVTP